MSESRRPSFEDFEVLQQLMAEMARTNPAVRAAMSQTGSGGMAGPRVSPDEWPAMVAALRTLPDDAGQLAINQALGRWYGPGEQGV